MIFDEDKRYNKSYKDVKLPDKIKELTSTLSLAHTCISPQIHTIITISKLFEMFSTKRICFNESGKISIPNLFALVFLQSGGGKDRLVDNLDTFVFKPYFNWFEIKGKEAIDKCDNEKYKKYKLVNEIQDATAEGIALLGKLIKDIGFGSIYVKIPEFGLYIKNGDNRMKQFLGILCSLYSCIIPNKIIKTEIFREVISGIPTNVLAYSDFTLFLDDIKSYFKKILNTGYCRRFIIIFQEKIKLSSTYLTDAEERQIYQTLEKLGNDIFHIFEQVAFDSCYELTAEAKDLLNQYKMQNNQLHNAETDPLLQREINSRELKSLKLSCLYAALNHPTRLEIDTTDMEQAIDTIEFLSQDFKKFLNYKPVNSDKYQKIFKYLLEHEGREFSKGQLMNILTSHFGYSREPLRKGLYKELYVLYDIAVENGYTILKNKTKNRNGAVYSLIPYEFEMNTSTKFITDCGDADCWLYQ